MVPWVDQSDVGSAINFPRSLPRGLGSFFKKTPQALDSICCSTLWARACVCVCVLTCASEDPYIMFSSEAVTRCGRQTQRDCIDCGCSRWCEVTCGQAELRAATSPAATGPNETVCESGGRTACHNIIDASLDSISRPQSPKQGATISEDVVTKTEAAKLVAAVGWRLRRRRDHIVGWKRHYFYCTASTHIISALRQYVKFQKEEITTLITLAFLELKLTFSCYCMYCRSEIFQKWFQRELAEHICQVLMANMLWYVYAVFIVGNKSLGTSRA